MKLSIIIPAYNVEQYLERCIESCEHQDISHNDYELIVINDGSSDRTLQIANKLADEYENIIVLTQKNQGQSVARNYGIESAKGEYIWFVDSDDYIDINCISSLYSEAEENKVDILLFGLKLSTDNNKLKGNTILQHVEYNKVYKQGELMMLGYNVGTICDAFFKRDFILKNQLRFVPNLIHQDSEFSIRAIALAKAIIKVDKKPYTYFVRKGSTLTTQSVAKIVKREVDNARIAEMTMDFALKQQALGMEDLLVENLLERSKSMHVGSIMSLWRNRIGWGKNGINKLIIDELRQLNLYPIKGPFNNWKQAMFVKLILNNSWLFT